jgi:aerobic-type carbon monoxide dehydrogenase small subunit (CoxS/CutS family)
MSDARGDGGAKLVTLTVNGQDYPMVIEPQQTLREVLHDDLGLVGVKEMCDRGACGSCTVIMDGRPILSCMTLAIECGGHEIETIEDLAADKHPLVQAYADHHAMQCGYCTPGFVMTAKALLDRNPNPTVEEIKTALEGNICRCGTYPAHIPAVLQAASQLQEEEVTQ